MSIPKGLILYRSQRHRESLPMNIKQGYYPDKISTFTKRHTNFHLRYQKKLSQGIDLKLFDYAPRENKAIGILSKLSHVKKCRIEPAYQVFQEKSIKSMSKVFQRAFKVLKRIKKLEIYLSGKPQGRAQASKNLLLLTNLESLILPSFIYSENDKTMKLFMEAVKSVSKRKSWPHLKSLHIQFLPPYLTATNPENDGKFTRSLLQLLKFIKDLMSYEEISKCLSLKLNLSSWASINPEQAYLLNEIAQTASSITGLQGCEANRFSALSEMVQHLGSLKEVSLSLHGISQPDLDLSILNKLPNFQELTLLGIFLEKQLLTQIKSLKNLTGLSLKLRQMPAASSIKALDLDLAGVISDLANLKSFELDLSCLIYFGRGKSKLESHPWLHNTFQAIGKKSRLEKLSLNFSVFDFEKAEIVFKDFCQHIENLNNLSYFKLHIAHADTLGDEEVLILGRCLSKLTKLEVLSLRLTKGSNFDTKSYLRLIDGFVKNLPLLSRLSLMIGEVKINEEFEKLLSEVVDRMRLLNTLSLDLQGGDLESDVGLRNLGAQIRKKRVGGVDYFNKNEGYVFRF